MEMREAALRNAADAHPGIAWAGRPVVRMPWKRLGCCRNAAEVRPFQGQSKRGSFRAVKRLSKVILIALAVLIDRGGRELPIQPDVVGKKVEVEEGGRVDVLVEDLDGKTAVVVTAPERDDER